jgi:hypothetical protein
MLVGAVIVADQMQFQLGIAAGKKGLAQGGVLSPVLSNLYLNEVDRMFGTGQGGHPQWILCLLGIRAVR